MDGSKERLSGHLRERFSDSLQLRLSLWLTVAILAVAALAGVLSFAAALDEANELQDETLRQVSKMYARGHVPAPNEPDPFSAGDKERVVVQLLSAKPSDSAAIPLDTIPGRLAALPDGIHSQTVNGTAYRMLLATLPSGERLAVAQDAAVRDESAREGALRTLLPFLIVLPVLLIVVAVLVRRLFQPMALLAREIDQRDQRSEQDLQELATHGLPAEVRPFVVAINRLLARVAQAMQAQRRFVADAAHELRSPLTALSLQAESLAGSLAAAELPPPALERLAALRLGIERSRVLLNQMLALARAQSPLPAPPAPVPLQRIFRRVLEDLYPLAEQKNLDIGMAEGADVAVLADEIDLLVLVKNLVDNAIRYTPAGGRIDLRALDGGPAPRLQVSDSGPGIPPEQRQRVFDPFFRTLGNEHAGSGLGLSIVATVAARLGAQLQLDWSDPAAASGLQVTVVFPPHPAL